MGLNFLGSSLRRSRNQPLQNTSAAIREQRYPHPAATPHNLASPLHPTARNKLHQLPRLNPVFSWQFRMQASPLATLSHFKGILHV